MRHKSPHSGHTAKFYAEIPREEVAHDSFSSLHEIQPVATPSRNASAIHQMSFKNK
jgi:hypothetical protein